MATLSQRLEQIAGDDEEVLALAIVLGLEDVLREVRALIERAAAIRDDLQTFADRPPTEQAQELALIGGHLVTLRAGFQHLSNVKGRKAAAKVRAEIAAKKGA